MSSILELTRILQQRSAAELEQLVGNLRGSPANLEDMFDLAKFLLGRRELEARIRALPRTELQNLRLGRASARLKQELLADADCFPEAVELANQLESKPTISELVAGGPLVLHETMLAITEILFSLEQSWLEVTRSGIKAADARVVAEKLHVTSQQIQRTFALAMRAGLIAEHLCRWAATEKGQLWIAADRSHAWLMLAEAVWDLPPGDWSAGSLLDRLHGEYPLLDTRELLFLQFAPLLGLLDGDSLLFDCSEKLDSELAGKVLARLPVPEDRVIVQSDLSIICPGPISPQLHRQLDAFADSEELGLASRFRLSALSLSHALETGGDLDQTAALLRNLSGRDLPQPVEYLLQETRQRFGQLRVLAAERTVILSPDPILLAQIANERALLHLGLRRGGEQLESQAGQEVVYFSLRAAGYVAVMADSSGQIISPRLQNIAQPVIDESAAHKLLVQRLVASELQTGAGDVRRQLGFALKNKLPVRISYKDAAGTVQTIKLMPLGMTETRLRGRESVREAEQTLPLSRIIEVALD